MKQIFDRLLNFYGLTANPRQQTLTRNKGIHQELTKNLCCLNQSNYSIFKHIAFSTPPLIQCPATMQVHLLLIFLAACIAAAARHHNLRATEPDDVERLIDTINPTNPKSQMLSGIDINNQPVMASQFTVASAATSFDAAHGGASNNYQSNDVLDYREAAMDDTTEDTAADNNNNDDRQKDVPSERNLISDRTTNAFNVARNANDGEDADDADDDDSGDDDDAADADDDGEDGDDDDGDDADDDANDGQDGDDNDEDPTSEAFQAAGDAVDASSFEAAKGKSGCYREIPCGSKGGGGGGGSDGTLFLFFFKLTSPFQIFIFAFLFFFLNQKSNKFQFIIFVFH